MKSFQIQIFKNGLSVLWRSECAAPSKPLHAGCDTAIEVWWATDRASRVGVLLSLQPECSPNNVSRTLCICLPFL